MPGVVKSIVCEEGDEVGKLSTGYSHKITSLSFYYVLLSFS